MPIPKKWIAKPAPGIEVSITDWGNGSDLDAKIDSSTLAKLCSKGEIPPENYGQLTEEIRFLLIHNARSLVRCGPGPGQFSKTRKKLRAELVRVRRALAVGEKCALPDWLLAELEDIEARRLAWTRLGLEFPYVGSSLSIQRQVMLLLGDARCRAEASVRDPTALKDLIEDAIDMLKFMRLRRAELSASRGAAKPMVVDISDWVMRYWTEDLGRPAVITAMMVGFAEAVLQIHGVKVKGLAIKEPVIRKQLEQARKRAQSRH
jgi:hypothetical protein